MHEKARTIFFYIAVLFIFLSSSSQSNTQMLTQASNRSRVILPLKSTTDQAAIAAMQTALTNLGGAKSWQNIRSAKAHATTSPDGTKTTVIAFMDDWSTKMTRFRRRYSGSSAIPKDHNGSSATVMHTKNGDKAIPEYDQARVLLGYLPGAAIEVMLRRPEYVFKTATMRHCNANEQCVDVYRKPLSGPTVKEQEWTISTVNGLPIAARYAMTNMANASQFIWEEIDYSSFQSIQGIMVPNQAQVGLPNGLKRTFTYSSFTFNRPFDPTAFDAEVIQ